MDHLCIGNTYQGGIFVFVVWVVKLLKKTLRYIDLKYDAN